MCRFISYLGKKPVMLNHILGKPKNSLIHQSKQARESKQGLNADGFGLGWYDHAIDNEPGLFKSVQPAWNDSNLQHVAEKIRSTCFSAHVRASSVGDVNTFNCHPFSYQQFLFVHNGTIRGFDQIKRTLLNSLGNDAFNLIKGQTDSEHFFALLMDILYNNNKKITLDTMANAVLQGFDKINSLQAQLPEHYFSRINTVLTDGKQLVATRYVSDKNEEASSLHYTIGDHVETQEGHGIMHSTTKKPGAILVASETLTDYAENWHDVPTNHMLLVDQHLKITMKPIKL